MPSAQVAFSGTEGGQFRATVDMTRSYSGTAAQNYETWTITGYVDRIATGITGYSRPDAYYQLDTYTFQPGESAYGNVSINFSNSVGRKFTTSINNMTIERFDDGTGLSSTAEFYFFAGFVGCDTADAVTSWAENTVPRTALVTATSGNIYETDNPSITFTNPAGFVTDVFLELVDLTSTTQYAVRTNVTSPYTWTLTTPERDAIRTAMTNNASTSLGYGVKTNVGAGLYNISFSTITIDNRSNIASPTFTTWGITDTHAGAIGATSGGNPVMVQGKSTARATVTVANKAVAIKQATMGSYTFSVGPSTQGFAYSGVADVTKDISLGTSAPLISGSQTMAVSAIDSRTYSTTVNKTVLVLPYANPTFSPTIKIAYTNRFDTSGGLSVTLPGGTTLTSFSPLNTGGTDYNVINTSTGVQYQLHKDVISGANPWNNIATATTTGSGTQTVTAATLATSILSTMNGMGADNTVTWYVIFRVTDKYNTNLASSAYAIDIGAPIFRIGVDGNVYNNEKRILTTGDYTPDGWTKLTVLPDLITSLGQHSFTVRYPGVDYSGSISKGMRLLLYRNTIPPTQCAGLNGTSQYFRKVSPNGMTFTDDYTAGAWVKLTSYPTGGWGTVVSRATSTTGWAFDVNADGRVRIYGWGSSAGRQATSYQSLQLNKWYYIAASMDLSGNTASIYIDGVSVPRLMTNLGAGANVLVQGGDLEIGSKSGGLELFPGRIAQVSIYSAIISEATLLAAMNQGLTGSETSLVSAYTLSGSITDLKGSNANNLTVLGSPPSPVDGPFAQGADALGTAGVKEYGIVTNVAFSTDTTLTVQTPTGSVFPVTGTIAAAYYSNQRAPYGFPSQQGKWVVNSTFKIQESVSLGATSVWHGATGGKITVPIGEWDLGYHGQINLNSSANGLRTGMFILYAGTPNNSVINYPRTARTFSPVNTGAYTTDHSISPYIREPESVSTATVYGIYGYIFLSSGTETYQIKGDQGEFKIFAYNAYL